MIRYYMDRTPTEMDYESMEIVATNISASIGLDAISHIDLDCQYATDPIGKLDQLDGLVYGRREYDI
ncbi:hypothetical protein AGMMS50243_28280 [Betaproteobacteria bacterium]|nr:hypothetical protein AGMMS50243_28280 [Betaproteobacteria bacterium]